MNGHMAMHIYLKLVAKGSSPIFLMISGGTEVN